MSELTREGIAAIDPAGMLDDVLAMPGQLADALWRVESAGVRTADHAGGLLVCGMGGSAIGADLAIAAIGDRALRPLRVARGYALPPGTPPDTLVLCASYSGETEETLACFDEAAAAGLPILALTTGGSLAARAREYGCPVIGVPSGMQPRAAVVYMTVGALEAARLAGAAPDLREEIEASASMLRSLGEEWGPGSADDSLAKDLARSLHGSIPVIYGAAMTDAPALRFKCQINENAEMPAFRATLPEADHNELCSWPLAALPGRLSAIFLDDDGLDGRLRTRIELTADAAVAGAAHVQTLTTVGGSGLERVLSLVLLGDLTSVYLAALDDRDPTPVEAIERFKRELAER